MHTLLIFFELVIFAAVSVLFGCLIFMMWVGSTECHDDEITWFPPESAPAFAVDRYLDRLFPLSGNAHDRRKMIRKRQRFAQKIGAHKLPKA